MSTTETGSYLDSPAFNEAMGHFRIGRWDEGLQKLGEVEKKFPMATDLRSIRQEMEVRARISEYEAEENKRNRRKNLGKFTLRLIASLVIMAVIVFAISTYSKMIQAQWAKTQSDITKSWEQVQQGVEFRNANQLLSAGKSDEALAAFQAIEAQNPNYPGISDAIAQAQALKDVEILYSQAMNLLQIGDSAQALDLLQKVSAKMPNYRDVSLQIKSLRSETEMTSIFEEAEQAFSEARYEDAITNYESLRIMDPDFKTATIAENLFQSYIKAAQSLLLSPVPTLDTLKKIDEYFSKALSLKPMDREALAARTQVRTIIEDSIINEYVKQAQDALAAAPDALEAQQAARNYLSLALGVRDNDPNVLLQFRLAQAYIKAVDDFTASKWDATIQGLEYVVEQQAGYASGTALQTLYDAYIARGSDYIASGEYALALEDFQRSAVLAQQLPESDTLAFEAQIMIGEAQGSLNHYQQAVQIYQDAINSIGLRERILALQNTLTDSLSYAEYLADVGNYQSAFYAYENLISNRVKAYDQSVVVTVKSGDYLSMLAHRYKTTVAAILSANDMNNQPRLTPDTQLIIPTLP